jgi:hypothetical protein
MKGGRRALSRHNDTDEVMEDAAAEVNDLLLRSTVRANQHMIRRHVLRSAQVRCQNFSCSQIRKRKG